MASTLVDRTVGMHDEIGLTWVIVDGDARSISEFASTPPRRRPPVFCPHCGERLTLKLGAVRRHHAAHRAGADCLATRPESALHLDCKFALAAALRAAAGHGATLSFARACAGSDFERCDRVSTTTWDFAWDDVRVEHRLGDSRRPDVLLLRDGAPVGAIEIVVSHTVAEEKANALAAAGIPWVEIDADPLRREAGDWRLDEPLDARRANDVAAWRCPQHERERVFRASVSRPMAVREPSPDACVRSTILRAARVADVYHPSGGRERFIYRILEQLENGVPSQRRLMRGTLEVASVDYDSADVDDDSESHPLQLAFRADVAKLCAADDCFADSPMRWAGEGIAEFIANEAMFDRRLPDPTVLATTFPRRWFYSPQTKRWFLPERMRDVRWDRGADDPLGPHPASDLSARTSSTHPAPEGSWSTLIFARRPSGAMFGRDVTTVAVTPGIVRLDIDLANSRPKRRRSVFVVEQQTDDATLARVIDASSRDADHTDAALWLSHPRDWRPALSGLAWAPAGCDRRGRGAIVIDGTGVFHATAFIQAVARRDRRLHAATVREAMAPRVERLSQRRASSG